MEREPFISVVIPTHNRISMLKHTLDCLMNQTYSPHKYEIIVVDNGSNDGTKGYLEGLASHGKVKYIRQQPKGPAVARNVGARAARGQVIAFTDDDCLPEANWLESLAQVYASGEKSLVMAVGGSIENVLENHWLQGFYAMRRKGHCANDAETPDYLDTANASFNRSVFLALGGFHEHFPFPCAEDADLGFRFTAAGYKLHTTSKAIVKHIGRTSLWGMIKQSFNKGRGDAFIKIKYPERFAGSPSRGLRLKVRCFLNNLLQSSFQVSRFLRPLCCGLTATLRQIALTLPETEYFIRSQFIQQLSRYRELGMKSSHIFLYLLIEWLNYIIRLVGQLVGTFSYIYNQTRSGHFRLY